MAAPGAFLRALRPAALLTALQSIMNDYGCIHYDFDVIASAPDMPARGAGARWSALA